MKSIDMKINCGVRSGQPALNRENPATTPVSHVVFLCPASKGMLGWIGNILNTCRSLVIAVENIPALVLNLFSRSIAMNNPLDYYERVHPHDLISRSIQKIDFLNCLIAGDTDCVSMTEAAGNGLYFSLLSITQELELALNKLQEARP